MDTHAKHYRLSRQVEGATPQPLQKMACEKLVLFAVKQQN
jgi:hypothetical protein